ncbi:MAG: hypothetical protein QME27_04015 [Syntrophaceae bacterium]|nr:hypothetical protein [Syntrophaceae bacterium]
MSTALKRKTQERAAPVTIWCKVYTNNFSEKMIHVMATGDEIYNFLMSDCGCCHDENGNPIPGDCNLWYLGMNEKFGELSYRERTWRWSSGESSFDNVELFVIAMYRDGFITKDQINALMEKIDEGRHIGVIYRIGNYLLAKREGKPWE